MEGVREGERGKRGWVVGGRVRRGGISGGGRVVGVGSVLRTGDDFCVGGSKGIRINCAESLHAHSTPFLDPKEHEPTSTLDTEFCLKS